jgi:trans-2,3-dihydro-3-hydroxyanthranilate isomerase
LSLLAGDTLDYLVVDVFVGAEGRPYAGNPLAVVLDGDDLSTAQCQALAREFHLSETVFPIAPTVPSADYRVRIFTITSELPFAGHPSVGVAWVLAGLERIAPGRVTQECGAGLVTLDIPADAGAVTLTGPLPTASEPVDAAPLLSAVGLADSDLSGPPPRMGGSGVPFAYLSVRPGALESARPDLAALAALTPPVTGILVFALTGAAGSNGPEHGPESSGPESCGAPVSVRGRMFAADIGGEDPATGSAALGLGGWLVGSGVATANGETAYTITQGLEMGRPSELRCDVTARGGEIRRVRVTGRVAAVASGRIRVP